MFQALSRLRFDAIFIENVTIAFYFDVSRNHLRCLHIVPINWTRRSIIRNRRWSNRATLQGIRVFVFFVGKKVRYKSNCNKCLIYWSNRGLSYVIKAIWKSSIFKYIHSEAICLIFRKRCYNLSRNIIYRNNLRSKSYL